MEHRPGGISFRGIEAKINENRDKRCNSRHNDDVMFTTNEDEGTGRDADLR